MGVADPEQGGLPTHGELLKLGLPPIESQAELPLPEPITNGSHLPAVSDILTFDLGANSSAICNRCRSFYLAALNVLQQLQSI